MFSNEISSDKIFLIDGGLSTELNAVGYDLSVISKIKKKYCLL